METIHKVRARIMQALGIFITCLFMLMTIIGTCQIIACYFFNKPGTASEKLLTYGFTWMALLTFAHVFGKRDHMRTGFLADKISGSVRKYLEAAIGLLTFVFTGMAMVYGGISTAKLTMIQTAAFLRVPVEYIYVVVSVTGIIITIFSLMSAVDMLHTNFSKEEDAEV